MTRPDLTVIVIACDVLEELRDCLRAVHAHSEPLLLEVIYVDNASRDGSPEAVRREFPGTVVVELERNAGLAARNEGLRRARGRTRAFLDSDALVTQGTLPELVRFLDGHPEFGLVGPRLVYPDGSLQLSCRRFPPPVLPLLRRGPVAAWAAESATVRRHLMADEPHDRTREVEYVLGACQVFTERAQQAGGEIDPRMFFGPDDADWCFSIRRVGLKIAYHPAATVVHDYRRSSARRPVSRIAFEQLRAYVRFQWKWRRERAILEREGREMDARAAAEASAAPRVD